jgi:alpha-N-acetylglucosaminidase
MKSCERQLGASTMFSVGITPEGIHQNYVVYEFALEKAWQHREVNHKKWVKQFSSVRYGFESQLTEQGWVLLLRSVYAFEGAQNIRGKYTICRRPSLRLQPWKWYDEKHVEKALGRFITMAANESVVVNKLFERDLVDLTRQFLQNKADALYVNIVDAFKRKKSLSQFTLMSQQFLDLLSDLDSLLATHKAFLLGTFLEAAKALASDDTERKQLEFNARNQITLWGPKGQINDYATKQWSGIVKDYFVPRWSLFFEQLGNSLASNSAFNQSQFQEDVFQQVEFPFNVDTKAYPTEPIGK